MRKKQLFSSLLALSLGFSSLGLTSGAAYADTKVQTMSGSGFDAGVANEERLIKMLQKEGILSKQHRELKQRKQYNNF